MIRIKNHLKDNRGDIYIQMLVCTMILLLVSIIIFTLITSVSNKMWLDNKLDYITKTVATTGSTKGSLLSEVINEITDRFGGTISFVADYIDEDEEKARVQLDAPIEICYHNDEYVALNIFGIKVSTVIDLHRTTISSVYYKITENPLD